jgi:hypothetical protein
MGQRSGAETRMKGAIQLQASGGLMSILIRYAIYTGDKEKAELRQQHRHRSMDAGDGACDDVGACRMRNDDDAGLVGGGEGGGGRGLVGGDMCLLWRIGIYASLQTGADVAQAAAAPSLGQRVSPNKCQLMCREKRTYCIGNVTGCRVDVSLRP